jgi:uncharacterized membrane protein
MEKNKKQPATIGYGLYLAILFIIAGAILSYAVYGYLPDKAITHWGLNNKPNGYMDKTTALLIFPLLTLGLTILFYVLPKIDPLYKNIAPIKKTYYYFIAAFAGFLLYVHIAVIAINLGAMANLGSILSAGLAGLIYYAGVLLGKTKRNYTIGVRIPWTLNNDNNWDKTHKLASKLFKTCAAITLLGIIFPEQAIFIFVIPLLLSAAWVTIYSYNLFRKQKK